MQAQPVSLQSQLRPQVMYPVGDGSGIPHSAGSSASNSPNNYERFSPPTHLMDLSNASDHRGLPGFHPAHHHHHQLYQQPGYLVYETLEEKRFHDQQKMMYEREHHMQGEYERRANDHSPSFLSDHSHASRDHEQSFYLTPSPQMYSSGEEMTSAPSSSAYHASEYKPEVVEYKPELAGLTEVNNSAVKHLAESSRPVSGKRKRKCSVEIKNESDCESQSSITGEKLKVRRKSGATYEEIQSQRVMANVRERQRTESLNKAFGTLKTFIPNFAADKMSKIQILKRAARYIEFLYQVLNCDAEDPANLEEDGDHNNVRSALLAARDILSTPSTERPSDRVKFVFGVWNIQGEWNSDL